jgi:DNA mismatch endonuclease (patch repair protein)
MQANKGRDTTPEMRVRRLAHARGFRYRVDARPLTDVNRRADLVFRKVKLAVFIDGYFWHGCPIHHTRAKSNAGFWSEKVAANRTRDLDANERLDTAGWLLIRAWEHESLESVVDRIELTIHDRGVVNI